MDKTRFKSDETESENRYKKGNRNDIQSNEKKME